MSVKRGHVAKNWGGKRIGWIAAHLPASTVIPKASKNADMIWLAKVFGSVLSFLSGQQVQSGSRFTWAKRLFGLGQIDHILEWAEIRGEGAGKRTVKREDEIE